MKKFIGLVLAVAGAAATLWGGYHLMVGESAIRLELTRDFSVTALQVGLVGVTLLTVGLLWARD